METKEGLTGTTGGPGPLGTRPVEARGAVLDKAKAVINGCRQDQYGNPEDSFKTIAALWTAYINRKGVFAKTYEQVTTITNKDVALMMTLLKIAREMHGAGKEDNLIDAAGYIGLAADMSNYKEKVND